VPLALKEPSFDRSFDDIYAELRARIPRYNPAWTNFNDSDPGITLLQLFAWLAEITYHRMGDVPRKNYLKFAELLGLELDKPMPATVRLAFTPKTAEPPRTIPAASRYSAQVEGSPPVTVMFETTRALDVIGAPLAQMFVFADGTIAPIPTPTVPATGVFWPLGRHPEAGDALYLGFKPNPSNPTPFPSKMTFLALLPTADTKGAAQRARQQDLVVIAPVDLVWEYRPNATQDAWERLNVLQDSTAALTRDGYIEVEGPQAIEPSVDASLKQKVPEPHYWLRLRLDQGNYPAGRPPRLEFLLPNCVDAVNLVTEGERLLGTSNGRADQFFDFPERPVDASSLKLEIRPPAGDTQTDWTRVDDFFVTGPDDRHYVLDEASGRITFGDGAQGQIVVAGATVVATTWRHGGSPVGNGVIAGAVKTMVSQIAGIEKVVNPRAAAGGAAEEDLQHFIKNAAGKLRNSDQRVVTAQDFEKRSLALGGVRKARALGGRHPDYPNVEIPGAVTVLIVADSDELPPSPSAELIESVCRSLDAVRLITTEVYVAAPRFIELRIEARLFADPQAAFDQVAEAARTRLDDYLSPLQRDFGENISPAAIYARLFGEGSSSGVRSVENLFVYVDGQQHDAGRPVEVPADSLVYPGHHLIVVRPDQDDGTP